MSDESICIECHAKHSRRVPNAPDDLYVLGRDRADRYCSDECRDGAEVRVALGKGGNCTACGQWCADPLVPNFEFGTKYCSLRCMHPQLQRREVGW